MKARPPVEGHDSCLPLPKRKKKQERVETVNEIDQESVLFCLIITQQFTFELFFFISVLVGYEFRTKKKRNVWFGFYLILSFSHFVPFC